MLLWGVSFVASRYVLALVTPFTYVGVRFAIAGVLFVGLSLVRGLPRLSRRTHLLIAATAFAEPVAYFLFESYGMQRVSATTASLVIATVPIVVMFFAAAILHERLTARGLIAAAVSLGGIALLVLGAPGGAAGAPAGGTAVGVLLVFGAVVSAAIYITLARGLAQQHDPVVISTIQTWWGSGVFVVLWLSQPPAARSLAPLDATGWLAIAFLAVGATLGAFMLYNWALSRVGAGPASIYINAIPVVTAVTGRILLDERLTPLQWVGAALVIGSVAMVQIRRRPSAGAPEPPIDLA